MPNWSTFYPSDIEYDEENDKLAAHGVTYEEAVECFYTGNAHIERDKVRLYPDRYQLIGQTEAGRRLKIIFQLKPGGVVRIITGWPH